jgi:hypothetical protein
MKKIAVICADQKLNANIQYYCTKASEGFSPVFLLEEEKSLSYLKYELPEICIIHLTDKQINILSILKQIKRDPWFHYSGIIGIHNLADEKDLKDELRGSNIISLIHISRFDFSFPRVLRILNNNRQILFQREIQSQFLSSISGTFTIDNDPFDLKTYANLITNYLYNASFIKYNIKEKLLVTLMELLINAVEHGNCKISNNEKTEWLSAGRDMMELIREKNKNPEINKKKVHFSYKIAPDKSLFIIRDEGDGFNWQKWIMNEEDSEARLKAHGHGIMMSIIYVQNLKYNDKGNEVSFEVTHQQNESNLVPEAFSNENEAVFKDKEIVFSEGEESNYLYYIVSGKFRIEHNYKTLSILTPNDIFLGEMSFLLNNKRSATVRSIGESSVLKISKKDFVNAIKEKPHYGLFLARLIAQRLAILNQQF